MIPVVDKFFVHINLGQLYKNFNIPLNNSALEVEIANSGGVFLLPNSKKLYFLQANSLD